AGIDQVGAVRDQDRPALTADLVDRALDGCGIVGTAVALGSLVPDVDRVPGGGRLSASFGRGSLCKGLKRDAERPQHKGKSPEAHRLIEIADHESPGPFM